MKIRYIIAILIILIFFLVILGSVTGEQCVYIQEDKACWKIASITVTSELCPNASTPCEAKPEQQQYNAISDLLLRACQKASQNSYSDASLNSDIDNVVQNFIGLNISTQTLCDNPGMLLTKRLYE